MKRLPDWHLEWGEVQELRNCTCGSTMAVVLVAEVEPTTRFDRISESD